MEPKIIGILGKKRHGKNTLALALRELGYTEIAFADPIKVLAMGMFNLSHKQVFGDGDKEAIVPGHTFSLRHALQHIGTAARDLDPNVWVNLCMRTVGGQGSPFGTYDISNKQLRKDLTQIDRWVITDVRFPNEAEAVKKAGGVIWKVHRPNFDLTDAHVSETSVDLCSYDRLFINDGSVEDLHSQVRKVLRGQED